MPNLISQKCIACEGAVKPMTRADFTKYLAEIPDWQIIEKDSKIEREFEFKDFKTAIEFVNKVASLAESEGHHPNIFIHSWNKVSITLYTHAIGGLFINDFILAAKIDQL